MTIAHHPGDELLLSYASGAAAEPVSLLVASHLALCSQCRAAVRGAEAAGGALLSAAEPAAISHSAYESVLARLDEPAAEIVRRASLAMSDVPSDVPAPLRPYIGNDLSKVRWTPVAPGLAHYVLMTRGKARARLIRARAGAAVAEHTHRGEEWTLVLTGSYHDVTGRYGPGDVHSTTPDVTHTPTADPGPVCINLAVTDAPLIFGSTLAKIVGKVFGF
jgi:putative transcriptional regulator